MRKLVIAAAAVAGLTGSVASAQVTASGSHMQVQHQSGGQTFGGNPRTWGPVNQPTTPRNGGNPRTWSPSGPQRIGGDPRTWGPGNQPTTPHNGGDPRTWGPGNQPHQWQGGGTNWGGTNRGGGHWGGGYVNGRWDAGNRAPGGWNGYRPPSRGWRMPSYWRSRDYRISNYGFFGLQAPPQGYGWSRYYDDAVLIDNDGRVYDSVGGIDWQRADQPYSTGYGYPSQGYWNSPNGSPSDGYDYQYGGQYGGAQGGQAYAGDGYAYAQGGQGGYSQRFGQQGGYYGGGYAPGASATATIEFDRGEPETTTTTTTTTEEWSSEPVVSYVPVTERVIYRRGPTRIVYRRAPAKIEYRTIVKKVPVYRAPAKKWRPAPRPAPACNDSCECGEVCGS